ncbi:MAG: response regulator [Planctomycetaceae bacterium]
MNRILLIGSESPTTLSLSRTLGGLGFGVDQAPDGPLGLALARKRSYSHVLIDDELTGGEAVGVFRQLQQLQKSTVGVLVTAVANLNTVFAAVEAGMRRVLSKPVDYDQLLALLDPTLGEATRSFTESEIASLSLSDIHERLSADELIDIIRSVDYPFAGKHRLAHFDRDTLERVVHLVTRWCRQRQRRLQETAALVG